MLNRTLTAGLLAAILTALSACGGARGLPDGPGGDGAPSPAAGLPALEGLPAPPREASLAAPGFHRLDHLATLARANAVDDLGSIKLDNAAGVLSYALYGVYGFDGDAYPVSVKVDVGAASGEFYLAFSDYIAGNWAVSGPFSADGEFGLPALDEHTSPQAFVSPASYHYFAVLAAPGALVYIDGLELGVSGGDNAPLPVWYFEALGGAGGLYLTWQPSESYKEPDFAGYLVERAPLAGGDFAALAASPDPATYFNDATGQIDTLYRYRIRTLDFSGNSSLSPTVNLGASSGGQANPVAVVALPEGPLYGPVDVSFDMTGSFDPEGEGITEHYLYYFNTQGEATVLGPNAVVTLQPGCYVFRFEVRCLDGRSGTAVRTLKVYPRWQESSVVVRATEPTNTWKKARLLPFKGALQPADGRPTLCGFDATLPGLAFHHYDGAGGFEQYRAPLIEEVYQVGEPIESDGGLLFPFCTEWGFLAAGFDGAQATLADIADHTGGDAIALSRDGAGKIWAVYGGQDGLDYKVYVDGELSAATRFEIATVAFPLHCADVVTDPATGRLLVFYEDAVGLQVADVDQVAQANGGDSLLGAGDVLSVDGELNPENGRVAVLYNIGDTNYYREQDGVGGWTAAVEIDNVMLNEPEADLAPSADGRLNAYFALSSGQANRYIYSGGVWSLANTSSFSADSGYELCLIPVAGSPDMRVADLDVNGVIRLARLNDDGTDNNFADIQSALGQGLDMHGAGGADGLHLVMRRALDWGTVSHLMSQGPGEGQVWLDEPSYAGSEGLNLLADYAGDVYATGFIGGFANLYWWNTGAFTFDSEQNFPAQFPHRPLLSRIFGNDDIAFGVWDAVGATYHLVVGKHGAYNPDSPYVPGFTPVWNATIDSNPLLPGILSLSGGAPDKPLIGWNPNGSDVFDIYAVVNADGPSSPYDKGSVAGRTFASTLAYTGLSQSDALSTVSVAALGSWVHPVRFTRPMFGAVATYEYPIGQFAPLFDGRVTVSVSAADGLTAVNLVASLDGTQSCFEWSDFGHWEPLDLPPGLDNLTQPLVVIGYDGRWHLVYRDWKTDAIMCRSTL